MVNFNVAVALIGISSAILVRAAAIAGAPLDRMKTIIQSQAFDASPEYAMSHALARAYDGIIIGAGQHGMVLGAYLAKAGLNILLVERRLAYGGGLMTSEATRPGFYHNLHSINHFHITETPWFRDLGLADRVTYITPRYEFGQAHLDGTALVLGRDLEETIANIARFSAKDAATFRE